jgi:hypothetical protein
MAAKPWPGLRDADGRGGKRQTRNPNPKPETFGDFMKTNEQTKTICREYRRVITETIERACLQRMEEIDGRVPADEEIREHGEIQITEGTGLVLYFWRGEPICEFAAAGFTMNGWRDAVISILRPSRILS